MVQRKVKIRLYGIDTPELRAKEPELRLAAQHARDALRKHVLNQPVVLRCYGKGKYGRWLCEIFVGDINVNQWLIEQKLARTVSHLINNHSINLFENRMENIMDLRDKA